MHLDVVKPTKEFRRGKKKDEEEEDEKVEETPHERVERLRRELAAAESAASYTASPPPPPPLPSAGSSKDIVKVDGKRNPELPMPKMVGLQAAGKKKGAATAVSSEECAEGGKGSGKGGQDPSKWPKVTCTMCKVGAVSETVQNTVFV